MLNAHGFKWVCICVSSWTVRNQYTFHYKFTRICNPSKNLILWYKSPKARNCDSFRTLLNSYPGCSYCQTPTFEPLHSWWRWQYYWLSYKQFTLSWTAVWVCLASRVSMENPLFSACCMGAKGAGLTFNFSSKGTVRVAIPTQQHQLQPAKRHSKKESMKRLVAFVAQAKRKHFIKTTSLKILHPTRFGVLMSSLNKFYFALL